ncbi:MAG: hypothetical protein PWP23_2591 [Candidatus Sumerlaeota bacterium]|nr:hypothetical protein [Candidatus Sumerlaeota bacterium]
MLTAINHRLRLPRRGLSIPEMVIAMAVFSTVGIFVSYVVLATARRSKATLSQLPADATAFRTAERVRSLVMPAQLGSVAISDSGASITYRNPPAGTTSRVQFDNANRQCLYVADVNAGGSVVVSRDVEGSFAFEGSLKRIRINVTTSARASRRGTIDLTYSDMITVRN